MSTTLNLQGKLNFSDIDSVLPEKVVAEIAGQIEAQTNSILKCVVEPYESSETSVQTSPLITTHFASALRGAFGDIQENLGEQGYEQKMFELCLVAEELPHYKFRILVFQYGIGGYPVHVILEHKIADQIQDRKNAPYVFDAGNRSELEDMIASALSTNRMIDIMQELINASYLQKGREKIFP